MFTISRRISLLSRQFLSFRGRPYSAAFYTVDLAKERAANAQKKAEKPEKKISTEKVKKSKAEGNLTYENKSKDAEDESSGLEDTSALAEEPLVEDELEVTLKKEKKEKKEMKEKTEEQFEKKLNKKALLEEIIRRDEEEDAPFFAIGTNPTPVNLSTIPQNDAAATSEGTNEAHNGNGLSQTEPPSGVNRKIRRRLRLIEEQREKIRNLMEENASEEQVQAKLDKWVKQWDEKSAAREQRKEERKEQERARIRSKKGKLLTGRRLRERKKQIESVEKKRKKMASKWQGMSAQDLA
ncbi:hypothetical protein F5Y11DRAFT_223721 [Daldinia sp. FL1419]|nr:hypothetical protein F5Y11DRAFT_223721 [Daldinia sp. FL1419]